MLISDVPDEAAVRTSARCSASSVRVAQQVQRTENAVHRRADLVAHRREELRLRAVRGFGRLLGDLQRSRREVDLEAVPDRADRGVAELPRGAEHRHAEQGDQHGQRQRHQALGPERHGDDAAELRHGEQEERSADQRHEQRGHRDRAAGEEDVGLLHPAVQVGEDAEAADQPHGSRRAGRSTPGGARRSSAPPRRERGPARKTCARSRPARRRRRVPAPRSPPPRRICRRPRPSGPSRRRRRSATECSGSSCAARAASTHGALRLRWSCPRALNQSIQGATAPNRHCRGRHRYTEAWSPMRVRNEQPVLAR